MSSNKLMKGLHISAKFREKRLRPATSDEGMIPFDLGLLASGNEEELREEYNKAPKEKRDKMLAVLFAVYGSEMIAERLGISRRTVIRARHRFPDIETAALLSRNLSIAEMSERKAFELISSLDVKKIEDKEKARSAKLLADVADLQYGQIGNMRDKDDEVDTEELIYRVKRRRIRKGGDEDSDAPLDVTDSVEVHSGDQEKKD